MAEPDSKDNSVPASGVAGNRLVKESRVWYDFGAMLKENPYICNIIDLRMASLAYLQLELRAMVGFSVGRKLYPFIAIGCFKAVDYSIRPPNPALLEGGPFIEYHEKHERLDGRSQVVPNTDVDVFNPPIQFKLLCIDQSYVIAEHFVMRIVDDGVTNRVGWTPEKKLEQMEQLKSALAAIDKYRLPSLPKR